MAAAPHISIKGETVLDVFGFPVSNSLLTSLIITGVFFAMAYWYASESAKEKKGTFFYVLTGALSALSSLFDSILRNKAKMFFTLLSSFFFFIILNNWFGLFPGVGSILVTPQKVTAEGVAPMEHHEEKGSAAHETDAERSVAKVETAPVDGSAEAYEEAAGTESTMEHMAEEAAGAAAPGMEAKEAAEPHKIPLFRAATADLNTTVALALISVLLTQYFGFKFIGAGEHLKKYSGVVGFLEGFSEISRLLSFSFRLFGNIFAGEVMIAVVSFLLPIMTPPFFLLEVFVGFIQAVVFSMLTAVFINLAIQKHH